STLSDSDVQRIADAVRQSIKGYIDTLVVTETHTEREGETHSETLVEREGERETELVLDPVPESDSETECEADVSEVEGEAEGDAGSSGQTGSEGEELVYFLDRAYEFSEFDGTTMYTDTRPYIWGDTVFAYKDNHPAHKRYSLPITGAVSYDIAVPPGDLVAWTMTPSSRMDVVFGKWRKWDENQEPVRMNKHLLNDADDDILCYRRGDCVTCATRLGTYQFTNLNPNEYAYLPITVSTRQLHARPSLTITQSPEITAAARTTLEGEREDGYFRTVERERAFYLARRVAEGMRFITANGVDDKGLVFYRDLEHKAWGEYHATYDRIVFAFPPCAEPTTWVVECMPGTSIKWKDETEWRGTTYFTREGNRVTASQTGETGELATCTPSGREKGHLGRPVN
ncbi:hypothetical protein KIPB_011127, partial [Kipferlia bialata]